MQNNNEDKTKNGLWRDAMTNMTYNTGAILSSKALRKYLYNQYVVKPASKTHIDLADIYGQIVSSGVYFEERRKLDKDGYFYLSVDYISNQIILDDRRVRKLIPKLAELGLINIKEVKGQANKFKVNLDKFIELTSTVDSTPIKPKRKKHE